MNKAVFLDRDGTIIENTGYPHEPGQVHILPGVVEAISLLNKNGFKVIIVTNQAGVARGYFTEETVKEINKYIERLLADGGAVIDSTYYCPHHTEGVVEKYSIACNCRKPNPGMIEQAARDFNIDFTKSYTIGDNISDIEAGNRTGCRTVFLDNGQSGVHPEAVTLASHVAPDLFRAVQWLLENSRSAE